MKGTFNKAVLISLVTAVASAPAMVPGAMVVCNSSKVALTTFVPKVVKPTLNSCKVMPSAVKMKDVATAVTTAGVVAGVYVAEKVQAIKDKAKAACQKVTPVCAAKENAPVAEENIPTVTVSDPIEDKTSADKGSKEALEYELKKEPRARSNKSREYTVSDEPTNPYATAAVATISSAFMADTFSKGRFFDAIARYYHLVSQWTIDAIHNGLDKVAPYATTVKSGVADGAQWVSGKATSGGQWVAERAGNGLDKVAPYAATVKNGVADSAQWASGKAVSGGQWVAERAGNGLDKVAPYATTVKNGVTNGAQWVSGKATSGGQWVAERAGNGLDKVAPYAASAKNGFVVVKDKSLDGGSYVYDLAMNHPYIVAGAVVGTTAAGLGCWAYAHCNADKDEAATK